MDKNNSYSEILNLSDDMNISVIVVGSDCLIKGVNRRGDTLLENMSVDRMKPCPSLFSGLEDPCKACPYHALGRSGRKSTVKEQTLKNGMVKKVIYRLTEDGDGLYIALLDLYEDSQSEALLKQSERLKRVLLDNLNSSFLIINEVGEVERAHFSGEISVILGKRAFLPSLNMIFNHEISHSLLTKLQCMTNKENRDMCHFRMELKGQILWLDFFISPIEGEKFFLSIVDKTAEHYLLERLEKLNDAELRCNSVNEVSSKVSNLIGGISGYLDMAIKKSENPEILDILKSMKQVSVDSINMLSMINTYSSNPNSEKKSEVNLYLSDEKEITPGNLYYLNIEKALELLENNHELYNTVVEDFIQDYGDVVERITYLFENDHEGAQILVHSIKGVAGILGAYSLQDEANLLEGYIRHKEWENAELSREKFSETLKGVLNELKQISRGDERMKDEDKWSLHGMTLNKHQADLLTENVPLAESGDYNRLKDNLIQFSSYDWGNDWTEITRILTEQVENIDFDGVLQSIHSLID